jgi:hypothetical protein
VRLEAWTRATWRGQIRGIGHDVRCERALWYHLCAGWSSLVARRAHNPEVVGSNPTPATMPSYSVHKGLLDLSKLFSFLNGFKWVQNSAQLPCDFRVVLTRNVSVDSQC